MTIIEMMDLCIDASLCKVEIFSFEKDGLLWSGMGDDIPDEYEDLEIGSFDVPNDGKMTFNID